MKKVFSVLAVAIASMNAFADDLSARDGTQIIQAQSAGVSITPTGNISLVMSPKNDLGNGGWANTAFQILCNQDQTGEFSQGYGTVDDFKKGYQGVRGKILAACPKKAAEVYHIVLKGKSAYIKIENSVLTSVAELYNQ